MSLGEQQAALLAALNGHGPIDAGWDADRVRATALALAHKRARSVARSWPSLKAMLSDDFAACFERYAFLRAMPQQGGPLADGRAFASWLAPFNDWSDAVRRQALQVDLRHRQYADGLHERRGPSMRAAWLPGARSWLLALRCPGLGEHHLCLRWLRPAGRSGDSERKPVAAD